MYMYVCVYMYTESPVESDFVQENFKLRIIDYQPPVKEFSSCKYFLIKILRFFEC